MNITKASEAIFFIPKSLTLIARLNKIFINKILPILFLVTLCHSKTRTIIKLILKDNKIA